MAYSRQPAPPAADTDFLARAAATVKAYSATFRDLTCDDSETIEQFDHTGKLTRTRTVVSRLIVYQARGDSSAAAEYRDVQKVDGKEVSGREDRARTLLEAAQGESDAAYELQRVSDESERYDLDHRARGFTLFQALPLREACREAFRLSPLPNETADGLTLQVLSYEQTAPCLATAYRIPLPPELRPRTLAHRGKLWIDAATARVVREEREIFLAGDEKPPLRVMRITFAYQPSKFGLNVPTHIVLEIYTYPARARGKVTALALSSRLTHEYGQFSRFSVSTKSRVNVEP